MKETIQLSLLRCVLTAGALAMAIQANATEEAHVHGLMHINVAIDKQVLTIQLESPLDSLLGFENMPKTTTQRLAVDAMSKQMNDGAALFKPAIAAQCKLTKATVESAVFQATAPAGDKEEPHADLDASYEFTCAQPDKLTSVEIGLFQAFPRLQKIEVQVAGPKKQSKTSLSRPANTVKLKS